MFLKRCPTAKHLETGYKVQQTNIVLKILWSLQENKEGPQESHPPSTRIKHQAEIREVIKWGRVATLAAYAKHSGFKKQGPKFHKNKGS